MREQITPPMANDNSIEESYLPTGMRLLQIAGGNKAFADSLREMIWNEYCLAGCPLGNDERGMFTWWESTF